MVIMTVAILTSLLCGGFYGFLISNYYYVDKGRDNEIFEKKATTYLNKGLIAFLEVGSIGATYIAQDASCIP